MENTPIIETRTGHTGLSAAEITAGQTNAEIGTELVLETDTMSVWHLRLAPGQTIPAHRHDRPYVWTVLTDGQGVSQFDDGRVVSITYTAGDTKNFPDLSATNSFVHDLTNTGETDLVFVSVEFSQNDPTAQ